MHQLSSRFALLAALCASLAAGPVLAQSAPPTPPSGGTPPGGTLPGGTQPGGSTAATLIGSTVTITQYYPDLASAGLSSTVTVSSAVEVACPDTAVALCNATSGLLDGESLDIGATSISGQFLATFTADAGSSFNGLVFSGLNFGTGYVLSGVTLSTNIVGLTSSLISYTANSVSINLLGLDPSVTSDGSGVGSFTLSLNVSSVPEPEPAALLAGGLALLGWLGRRRA